MKRKKNHTFDKKIVKRSSLLAKNRILHNKLGVGSINQKGKRQYITNNNKLMKLIFSIKKYVIF